MENIVRARILCKLNSKNCYGITLACFRHPEVNCIVKRFASRQTPRKKALFKFSGVGGGGYFLLLFPIATACLGTWQVKRRAWKLDLLSKIENRIETPPVPLPENLDELKDLEYARIAVRGKFDFTQEAIIAPRSNLNSEVTLNFKQERERSSGIHIVTPFKLADREFPNFSLTILVNRGWLSNKEYVDLKYRRNGEVREEIEIVGVVRADDKRNKTLEWIGFNIHCPNNEKGFLQRDIPAIAEALGTAPVFLDATELRLKPGAPLGGQTRINLPNNHGVYIVTWYALTAVTFWLWFNRYRRPMPPKNLSDILEVQNKFSGK